MIDEADPKDFLANPQIRKPLRHFSTRIEDLYHDEQDYLERLDHGRDQLGQLQERLYAHGRYSLLVILQGMDTAGKDSLIKHVFSGVNPQGCSVTAFKRPTDLELRHDFLWRCWQPLPERGHIGIFNRSYYEDVIVPRVHPLLLNSRFLPKSSLKRKNFWAERYHDLRNFEDYLSRQGTHIIKIYLHLSRAEQRKRLLARMADENKHYKFDPGDLTERQFWSRYQSAYDACIHATASTYAPWYVIPADDKKNARLITLQILIESLAKLDLRLPKDPKRSALIRKQMRSLARETR